MMRNGKPSWSVITEGTEELNFAIYVACTYDLLPNNKPFSSSNFWSSTTMTKTLSNEEMTVLKEQWIKWWNHIILARSNKREKFINFYSQTYSKSLPFELGQIYRELLEPFRNWWHMPAGGNTAMMFWESVDNVGDYVKNFESEVGRTANPFQLQVDLVYAGLDDVIEVSDDYVIMPLRSNRENKFWWIKKIKSIG